MYHFRHRMIFIYSCCFVLPHSIGGARVSSLFILTAYILLNSAYIRGPVIKLEKPMEKKGHNNRGLYMWWEKKKDTRKMSLRGRGAGCCCQNWGRVDKYCLGRSGVEERMRNIVEPRGTTCVKGPKQHRISKQAWEGHKTRGRRVERSDNGTPDGPWRGQQQSERRRQVHTSSGITPLGIRGHMGWGREHSMNNQCPMQKSWRAAKT